MKKGSDFYNTQFDFLDLNVIECGTEQCVPTKYVRGMKKKFFTLHIIENGKGFIVCKGKKLSLTTQDMFIIFPGEEIDYYPDSSEPWSYYWMCFEGLQADALVRQTGLSEEKPYFKKAVNREIMRYFTGAIDAFERKGAIVVECVGFLYVILGMLNRNGNNSGLVKSQDRYVKEVILFIYFNFNFNITTDDIAQNLHLSPNYLCSIFKKQMKMSLKQFLTQYRMNEAYKFMQENKPGQIKDLAKRVGYSDQLYFSKVFKKMYGKTPKEMWAQIGR